MPALKLKMLKYKCKTHMQICALLSQVHKHKEAVFHAREGIKIAHFLVKDLEQMAFFYSQELLQRKPLEEISIIGNFKFSNSRSFINNLLISVHMLCHCLYLVFIKL